MPTVGKNCMDVAKKEEEQEGEQEALELPNEMFVGQQGFPTESDGGEEESENNPGPSSSSGRKCIAKRLLNSSEEDESDDPYATKKRLKTVIHCPPKQRPVFEFQVHHSLDDLAKKDRERPQSQFTSLVDMPDEVLCKIFAQIGGIRHRIRLQLVCRRIRQVASEICWYSVPMLSLHIHSIEQETKKPSVLGISDVPHQLASERLSELAPMELNCQVVSASGGWKTALSAVEFIWKRARQLRGLQLAYDKKAVITPQDTISFLLREIQRLQAKFPREITRLDLQGYFVESPTSFTLLTVWSSRIKELDLVWESGELQSDKEMDCAMNTVSLCGELIKLRMTGNLRAPKQYNMGKALTIAFEGKENLQELNLNGFPVNNREFPLSGKDFGKALLSLDVTERLSDQDFKLTLPVVKPEFLTGLAEYLETENREMETICDYVTSFRVRYTSTRRLVFKDFKRYFELFPSLKYCELEPSQLQKFNNPGCAEVVQNFVQNYNKVGKARRRVLLIRMPKFTAIRTILRDIGSDISRRLVKMPGQCTVRSFEFKKMPHFKFIKGNCLIKLGCMFPDDPIPAVLDPS